MSDCYIINLKAFGKLTSDLATVLLYSCLQSLVIQDPWTPTVGFITQRQISRAEFLQPMPGDSFIHTLIFKGLTYSVTWLDCGEAQLKVKKQTTPNLLLRYLHLSSKLPEVCLLWVCKAPVLAPVNVGHCSHLYSDCFSSTWMYFLISDHLFPCNVKKSKSFYGYLVIIDLIISTIPICTNYEILVPLDKWRG